jgi:competence protein ComEC
MYLKINSEGRVRQTKSVSSSKRRALRNGLKVKMFNIGHGEAMIVSFGGGNAWLIEAGCGNFPSKNELLGNLLLEYLDSEKLVVDTFIPTHPHCDYVSAFTTILSTESNYVSDNIRIFRSSDSSWHRDAKWLGAYWEAVNNWAVDIPINNGHREIVVSDGVTVHLYCGKGQGAYTSLFAHVRYHDARLLFTGDAYCTYENDLLEKYGDEDFRADVLKVTHHGSSSGTSLKTLKASSPGMAIASTGDDSSHRLEADTMGRIENYVKRKYIFETLVKGDITLYTDGKRAGGNVLYEVLFDDPGEFAHALNAHIMADGDIKRGTSDHYPECSEE